MIAGPGASLESVPTETAARLRRDWEQEQLEEAARTERRRERRLRQYRRRAAFEGLAREVMDQHGLQDWYLGDLKNLRIVAPDGSEIGGDLDKWGACFLRERDDHTQSIYLAMDKASKKSLALQRDLILHEIAHALAGPGEGHGEIWAAKAEQIGVRPMTLMNDLAVAEHDAYRRRQRRAGNQARAAFRKRLPTFSERQRLTMAQRMMRGD